MREHKYRAWDAERKLMVYFSLFGTDNGYLKATPLMHDPIGEGVEYAFRENGKWWIEYGELVDELPVMDYTGLHDKNGKEIFEGDIIKHRMTDSATAEVVYENDGFWAKHITLATDGEYTKGLNIHSVAQRLIDYVSNDVSIRSFVIGNIWENPDLLK